jgi:hypothetical protein
VPALSKRGGRAIVKDKYCRSPIGASQTSGFLNSHPGGGPAWGGDASDELSHNAFRSNIGLEDRYPSGGPRITG